MRRMILFIFVLSVCSSVIHSQTNLTVFNPKKNAIWRIGATYTIRWNKTGSQNSRVKIRLYDRTGNTKITNISNDTGNDGTYYWTVPGSIAPGSYRVRVKTIDNKLFDDSDIFEIKVKPSHPDFEIDHMTYTQVGPSLMLRVKNNTGADYDGHVYFRIWINNVRLNPDRHERLYFKELHTWDIQILVGDDFKGISGNTTIKIEVDSHNTVEETNENNNSATQSFIINPGGQTDIDLSLAKIVKNTNPTLMGVNVHIKNTGLSPFNKRVSVALFRNGKRLKIQNMTPNINPGQTHIHLFNNVLIPGRNIIKCIVDYSNDYLERNERNNEKRETFYPDTAGLELVKNLNIGIPGHTKIVTKSYNRVIITPDMTRPSSSGNRAFDVQVLVRGLGTRAVAGYNIYIDFKGFIRGFGIVRSGGPAKGALQSKTVPVNSKTENGVTTRVTVMLYPWDGKSTPVNWTTIRNSFNYNLVIDSFTFYMEFKGF